MTRAQSRKHRGYKTQRLIAERWRQNGMAPFAKAAGAGESGCDVLDGIPGLAVEVKARDTISLPAGLRQARSNSLDGELPILIARHNGQGEKAIEEFTVSMTLADFEALWVRSTWPT